MARINHTTPDGQLRRRDAYPHPDNRDLTLVPVFDRDDRTGKLVAVIDTETFNRIIHEEGLSPYWHVRKRDGGKGKAGVKPIVYGWQGKGNGRDKARRVSIARTILLGAAPWDPQIAQEVVIKYRDGDGLNLRNENLEVAPRYASATITGSGASEASGEEK